MTIKTKQDKAYLYIGLVFAFTTRSIMQYYFVACTEFMQFLQCFSIVHYV